MIITRHPDSSDLHLSLDVSAGTTVTIGNFDGVHLGHQELLRRTCTLAHETGTLAVAFTFDPHPLEVLTPYAPPRLTSTRTRLALLEQAGVDLVVLMTFTKSLASMHPEEFIRRYLVEALNIKNLVLGYDFTLGKGRSGTPEILADIGYVNGYKVEQLPALSIHNDVVSSTRIRELLRVGQAWEASTLLGRLHSVRGEVIHGKNRGGRLLGFPTANLAPVQELLPKPGVYVTLATPLESIGEGLPSVTDMHCYAPMTCQAVTNIGYNPTFGQGVLSVETFLMDFNADLYGKPLEVAFVDRIRGEITFTDPKSLMVQIQKDVTQARKALGR